MGELTSRIGRPVNFKAPSDVNKSGYEYYHGEIIDEVWADPKINKRPAKLKKEENWGEYSFCAQLIKWEDNWHTIRLAYYRRRAGEDHWEFAIKMTVNAE